ncbi:MAG: bifunctional SulP family inorganic anion transporter/carbonic anhydrase [Planctomycetaceae bacterium]
MSSEQLNNSRSLSRDLMAGVIVFVVALPLCLGIALASGAPLFSGLIAGIVGGVVVGAISGSHTSVSGPAAGLIPIVLAQVASVGSFEAFLTAVILAGVIQVIIALMRAGTLSAFVPSSVIKGLLAAIGVILILKQIPHLLGHDADAEGEMEFIQPDHENTLSELVAMFGDIHIGALAVGLTCLVALILWSRVKRLRESPIPGPLAIVLLGVSMSLGLRQLGGGWVIGPSHLVQVPIAESWSGLAGFLSRPDLTQLGSLAVIQSAIVLAIVASLETLLNLEAVDKLDHQQRQSPPNRELVAQGVGNIVSGFLGGLPVTSEVVRGSLNISVGAQSKTSTIVHGLLLLVSVAMFPVYLNSIPLSCLAAILITIGYQLATPTLFRQMLSAGRYQFIPFIVTLLAIVFTDLMIGILIGLGVALLFILNSNLRRPVRRTVERHIGGEVMHIELSNQVSFLNRAAIERVLREAPRGSHVLLDASRTDYIDPDVLSLIREFRDIIAPRQGVQVSMTGFRHKYQLRDCIEFVDYSTRELQQQLTPDQVLNLLREGNERFRTGRQIKRDYSRQMNATAAGQHPMAVVLSCIDSRTPAELILDLGLGDVFSVRVAGNVTSPRVLGSLEYGCAVAGAKLILVVGHTRCGAVTASVELACSSEAVADATGCDNLEPLVQDIQQSVDRDRCRKYEHLDDEQRAALVDEVARQNALHSVRKILNQSATIRRLVDEGQIAVVGAMYDVHSGGIEFLLDDAIGLRGAPESPDAL